MNYFELKKFISKDMKMSHVYQPVMIKVLLEAGGSVAIRDIAQQILAKDESQLDYYKKIVVNMVGTVLRRRSIVRKDGSRFELLGHAELSDEQRKDLVDLCDEKISEYEKRRGNAMWTHRTKASGYVSGTLRYEILKRAQFHCELCGISADIRALEVDHIEPRSRGGTDDPENLQALCFSCNAMKRDRDNTDLRAIRESFKQKMEGCLFCDRDKRQIVSENKLAFVIRDGFAVTPLHTLVIPKRHVSSYFDLSRPEINACDSLLRHQRSEIMLEDPSVTGFNVGMNVGVSAGQTVFHCHIHLIPRRDGDVLDPRGGVRHLIPGKGYYDPSDSS